MIITNTLIAIVVMLALQLAFKDANVAYAGDDLDFLFEVGGDSTQDQPSESQKSEAKQSDEETQSEQPSVIVLPEDSPPQPVARKPRYTVEEIIVTANKRVENIQDVASGIQVMGGDDLEQSNASSFADYLYKVPGVDIVDSGVPKQIAIRGISNLASRSTQNNSSASPVGLYINDAAIQGNGIMPDLGLFDLQRVEVLKGPQGTFYGEGAMGGMIRMVLNEASPDAFMLKGELAGGSTRHGSGYDHFANVAVNIPLGETWATRLVASERLNQGYIDFTGRGTQGEDDAVSRSYRLHLDGALFDVIDVSAYSMLQKQHLDQFPQAQPEEEGELNNRNTEPQFQDNTFSLTSISLSFDAGFADISSTSSRFTNDMDLLLRFPLFSNLLEARIENGVGQTPVAPFLPLLGLDGSIIDFNDAGIFQEEWIESTNQQNGWSQEFRAVSSSSGWINWIAGVYYRERESAVSGLSDSNVTHDIPPPVGPGIILLNVLESFEQWSLYGELTFSLVHDLEFKLGYRTYKEDVKTEGDAEFHGPLFPFFPPDGKREGAIALTTSNGTFMTSLAWNFLEDQMLFVKYAEGSRSGGTNSNAIIYEIPETYEPDFLQSVEIGFKSQWWDRRLTANLAVYSQMWSDMQIGVTISDAKLRDTGGLLTLPAAAILNVTEAYSRGAELELGVQPIAGLAFGFNVFYGDGEIVKGDPDAFVPDGVRLPQLAQLAYSASAFYSPINYQFAGLTPFISIDTQFTGDRSAFPPGDGQALPKDSTLEAFTTWNAMLGLNGANWSGSLGLKNLTDERYAVGMQQYEQATQTIARPRSIMLKVAYQM